MVNSRHTDKVADAIGAARWGEIVTVTQGNAGAGPSLENAPPDAALGNVSASTALALRWVVVRMARRQEAGMRFRQFGPTERDVSIVGQGSWKLDSDEWALAVAALRRGFDEGMTHVDTAEMYGDAELLISEAMAGRRDELFLVSKVLPQNASADGVIEACERSLSRLGTDRLDCYLLHWRGRIPLDETLAGFEQLVRSGKILAWGVSNFDVADLDEALRVAGSGRIACNQLLYNLKERAIEHEVIPWCSRHGVAVVAYSPFGHGDFPDARSPGGRLLAEIAKAKDATPRQVALAFLARRVRDSEGLEPTTCRAERRVGRPGIV